MTLHQCMIFVVSVVIVLPTWAEARFSLQKSIVHSKHNLSVTGNGEIKAQEESQVCIFCHAPHHATPEAPLWNRYDSGQVYIPYNSTTTQASIGQPTGSSRLCLSCHDGMIALGMVRNQPHSISLSKGLDRIPAGKSNLGLILSHDHPISFTYDASLAARNPQIKHPSRLASPVQLDHNQNMQCTSCHDPHHDDNGKFLVVDNRFSKLCTSCHQMDGWDQSSHKASLATWKGGSINPWVDSPWGTVAENGCGNCHQPHHAANAQRLLNHATEEDTCFSCHNGSVSSSNVQKDFRKISVHPVMRTQGIHEPMDGAHENNERHVACGDCHNPHAVNDGQGAVSGALRMVNGIDRYGLPVNTIAQEYEICFKCHGDSHGTTVYVDRQFPQMNTRLDFDPTNASYHPILAMGKQHDVPSLILPYQTSSVITCTDCHNNNSSRKTQGSGSQGPHGSDYTPLLERPLQWNDHQIENSQSYALCYKCHDRASILNNESFSRHREHIVNGKAPCTACHDSHGVKNMPHLINFDLRIVFPNESGRLRYEQTGTKAGRCSLRCHEVNHQDATYGLDVK